VRTGGSLGATLALLWLALSGVYKPVVLALGVLSIGFVVWLSARMKVVGSEHYPGLFSWRLPVYWGWMIGQIVLANFHVAACVLHPGRHVRPRVVDVPAPHRDVITQVTYANSCTLTPGTVALALEGQRLTAHALTEASAAGLESGAMAAKVGWLEDGR